MADLFDTLRDSADDPTSVPPPEQIRRRGDLLRRRRTALRAGAAAVAVAAVATGGVLAAGSLTDGSTPTGPATDGPATSAPPVTPSEPAPGDDSTVARIPASFPLDVGIEELGTDGDLTGPGRDVRPLADLRVCGQPGYRLPATSTDHLGLVAAMPQFIRNRDLTLHPDPEAATAAAQHLVGAFEACPTHTGMDGETTVTNSVTTGDLGLRSWVVTQTFETEEFGPMLGQEVIQVVLADEALLVSWTSSEGPGATDAERLAASVAEDAAALEPVVAAICELVEADCG